MGAGIVLTQQDANSIGLGTNSSVGATTGAAGAGGSSVGGWLMLANQFLGGNRGAQQMGGMVSSNATSGVGYYEVINRSAPSYKKPLIDFRNPVHIAVVAVLAVGGMYLYKKGRK